MKKIIMISILLTNFCYMEAGIVNKKLTKVRVSVEGDKIEFLSKIPHLVFKVREVDFAKAMRNGYSRGRIEVKQQKIIQKIDKDTWGSIDKKNNGVTIKAGINQMFITDKELKGLKDKY